MISVDSSLSISDPVVRQLWSALLERLSAISAQHPDAAFASSLGAEDMLLSHAMFEQTLSVRVFTLDTGRLHPETTAMIDTVQRRYGVALDVLRPDPACVVDHVARHGAFAFYESLALRKECCRIRKVEPLARALKGRSAWLTGQRRTQSSTRSSLPEQEFDEVFGLLKYNPLFEWTGAQVWTAVRSLGIPYNPLHDQGYPSIGCEPCTRAVRAGEDERAGRWWWEHTASRECGLHAGNLRTPTETPS